MSDNAYSEESIVALKPMEHVRRRHQMYIGGTDSRAMHRLVYELIGSPIGMALFGQGTHIKAGFREDQPDTIITSKGVSHITVTLEDETRITVSDNGGGLPYRYIDQMEISLLEIKFTMMGVGSSSLSIVDDEIISINGWSLGYQVVNALSRLLEVTTKRDGWVTGQRFQRGIPDAPEAKIRPMEEGENTGTTISLIPDFEIFDPVTFDFWSLAAILREQAFLVKGLKITLEDKRSAPFDRQSLTFHFPEGIKTYLEQLDFGARPMNKLPHYPIVTISEPFGDQRVVQWYGYDRKGHLEIGLKYTGQDAPFVPHIFVNGLRIPHQGVETRAFMDAVRLFFVRNWDSITRKMTDEPSYASTDGGAMPPLSKKKLLRGVIVVFNIQHPDPFFNDKYHQELLSAELYEVMHDVIKKFFYQISQTNLNILQSMAKQGLK